jgi:Zn-dependent protease with chaperone function
MAMDFFEHQQRARRNTGRLVVMFVAAVLGIIAMTYLAVAVAVVATQGHPVRGNSPTLWDPFLFVVVGGAVILIVGVSSLIKMGQLAGGGRVVAESMGGRLLDTGSTDPAERKLLNVVEEMAIASGVPVPKVYVMDKEQAINAFAAGFSPDDAVIGVTRGCMDLLDRDELQGVIAHEFSHILNGDMRLNIRLIGILFGILVIGMIGRVVLRSMTHTRSPRRSSRSGKSEGGGIIVILGVALALFVIGYMGFFFGGLIKAAVSRQREFLADASAVQFTRYPDGIGGALKKIGGYSFGSRVLNAKADEVSHMFFSQGVSNWLGGLGATHPPLGDRIRRIDPRWDGQFPDVSKPEKLEEKVLVQQARLSRGEAQRQTLGALAAIQAGAVAEESSSSSMIEQIGRPTQAHVERAQSLLKAIPAEAADAAQSSLGACAVIYALLMSGDPAVHGKQVDAIERHAGRPVADLTTKLYHATAGMDRAARLPLIDKAMPTMGNLSPAQYQVFKRCVFDLVEADNRVDMFEWVLSRILLRRLAPVFEASQRIQPRVKYYSLKPVREHLGVLLSTLARYGHTGSGSVEQAFIAGVRQLELQQAPGLVDVERSGLGQLDAALSALNEVGPREKRRVIHACAACIAADKQVTTTEAELLRAVCDALGCPAPPLLPGQALV